MGSTIPLPAMIVLCAALTATAARADELQARVVAAARATRPDGYAFQRTVAIERTGAARRVLVERYDPRRAPAERWSLIGVDGHAPGGADLERSRKAKRGPVPSYAELAQWFGAPATRSDTVPGYVTYRFAQLPPGVLKLGSHDASADTRAEAVVNVRGQVPFVERVRFTSTKGFRMMLVASVQNLDAAMRYRQLPSGVAVPEAVTTTMNGSLMGKSGRLTTSMTFENVQPVR